MAALHVLQAVCPPLTSWYVPAPQPVQLRSATVVHEPVRYAPALQVVVQVLQLVCEPAVSWKVLIAQLTHEAVVVAVHVPLRY